jgi:hypothetical protein
MYCSVSQFSDFHGRKIDSTTFHHQRIVPGRSTSRHNRTIMGIRGLTTFIREAGGTDDSRRRTLADVLDEARRRAFATSSEGLDRGAHAGSSSSADSVLSGSDRSLCGFPVPPTFAPPEWITNRSVLVDGSAFSHHLWELAERGVEMNPYPEEPPWRAMLVNLPPAITAQELRQFIETEMDCELYEREDLTQVISRRGVKMRNGKGHQVVVQMRDRQNLWKLVHSCQERHFRRDLHPSALRPRVFVSGKSASKETRAAVRRQEAEDVADLMLERSLCPEYEHYARLVHAWIDAFLADGARLVFYADGLSADTKEKEHEQRRAGMDDNTFRTLDHVTARRPGERTDRGSFKDLRVGRGACAGEVLSAIIRERQLRDHRPEDGPPLVLHHRSFGEADFELAHDGRLAACVLSGDSDFFLVPEIRYAPLRHVQVVGAGVSLITCSRPDVAELVALRGSDLTLLGGLAGNDITGFMAAERDRLIGDDVTIESAADFIRKRSPDALDDAPAGLRDLLEVSRRSVESPGAHAIDMVERIAEFDAATQEGLPDPPTGLHRQPLRRAAKSQLGAVRSGTLRLHPAMVTDVLHPPRTRDDTCAGSLSPAAVSVAHKAQQVQVSMTCALSLDAAVFAIAFPALEKLALEYPDSQGNVLEDTLVIGDYLPAGFQRGLPLDGTSSTPPQSDLFGPVHAFLSATRSAAAPDAEPKPPVGDDTEIVDDWEALDSSGGDILGLLGVSGGSLGTSGEPAVAGDTPTERMQRILPLLQRLSCVQQRLGGELEQRLAQLGDELLRAETGSETAGARFDSGVRPRARLTLLFAAALSAEAGDPFSSLDIAALTLTLAATAALFSLTTERAASDICIGLADLLDWRRPRTAARNRSLTFRPADASSLLERVAVSQRYNAVRMRVSGLLGVLGLPRAAPHAFRSHPLGFPRGVQRPPVHACVRRAGARCRTPADPVGAAPVPTRMARQRRRQPPHAGDAVGGRGRKRRGSTAGARRPVRVRQTVWGFPINACTTPRVYFFRHFFCPVAMAIKTTAA